MNLSRTHAGIAMLVAALLACCGPERPVTGLDPIPEGEVLKEVEVSGARDLDVLFVIDDSASMADKQEALAAAFPRFMEVLDQLPGGLPDVHIGVVPSSIRIPLLSGPECTSAAADGRLVSEPRMSGCKPVDGAFLSDLGLLDGSRERNYDGTLAEAFACIALIGDGGCGYEMHLEAVRRVLDGSIPENEGFLRRDAYLAVVIVADEDDCSASDMTLFDPTRDDLGPLTSFRCTEYGVTCDGGSVGREAATYDSCQPARSSPYLTDPMDFVDFLLGLKEDARKVTFAVVAGDTEPFVVTADGGRPRLEHSCSGGAGSADPAVRLAWAARRFEDRGSFASVCDPDFPGVLAKVGEMIKGAIEDPCLPPNADPTDVAPDLTGLQVACAVVDISALGAETVLPRCRMTSATEVDPASARPCWWAVQDAAVCEQPDGGSNLAVHVDREAPPDRGSRTVARCVVR